MQPKAEAGGLTIVGLGPGTWDSLTMEAVRVLEEASEVYVRTSVHPSLDLIRGKLPGVRFHSFDSLYETLSSFSAIYDAIARDLAELGGRPGGAVYAVPGSPSVGETSVRLALQKAQDARLPVRLVQGLSFIEPILAAAEVWDAGWVEVIDATDASLMGSENAVGEVSGDDGWLPWRAPVPTAPLVISQLYDRHIASGVKLWLGRYYPDHHPVKLVWQIQQGEASSRSVPLYEIDRVTDVDHRTCLFVPPLAESENLRTFAGLMQLTRTLRAPGGCPWDREQTHGTLKPHLLEEAYEVLDALDSGEPALMAEELGDLLFQITIHSQIAAEAGTFTVEDVIEGIMRKLIGRHPHVFGELQLESAQDVRHVWESFKQREKPKRQSVLEEIPRGLPALPQSNLMQKRAASVGFEWPNVAEVLAKVDEELQELRSEIDSSAPKDQQREEFGDILFALVSVARHLRLDPEEALRLANHKFSGRFRYVEARAKTEGKSVRDLGPEVLDRYWQEAKEHS